MMRNRRRWCVALAPILLLALSGCVKLDMDLTVQADNTIDGTIITAVDKGLLTASGLTETALVRKLEKQGLFSDWDRPKQGTFSEHPYNTDGKIGRRYTFSDVPLTEFGGRGALSIQRKGDRFFVTGLVDMTTETPTGLGEMAIAERFGRTAETRIRITFPGEVLKSNGKIDGRSVTWHPKLGERTALSAEARTSAIIPVLLIVASAAAVFLVIVGLTVFLVLRHRRRRAPATVPGHVTGHDTGGYGAEANRPPTVAHPSPYRNVDVTLPLPWIDPPQPGAPSRPFGN